MNNIYGLIRWAGPTTILVLAVGFLLVNCSGTKKIDKEEATNYNDPVQFYNFLSNQDSKVKGLSAQGRFKFDDSYFQISGAIDLKMIRDSVIWLRAKKFGIEAARVKITKDSAFIINRLQNTYSKVSLNQVAKAYNIPGNFGFLEELLLGEPMLLDAGKLSLDRIGKDSLILVNNNNKYLAKYGFFLEPLSLKSADVVDKLNPNQVFAIQYDDFRPTNQNDIFSYIRMITLTTDATGAIDFNIQFSNIDFEVPSEIRFSIPSRYEMVDF